MKSFRPWHLLFFYLMVGAILSDSSAPAGEKFFHRKEKPFSTSELSEGYALLYDLASREKNVSKVLIIKKDTPQLKAVIKEIAEFSKQTANELELMAKSDKAIDLKTTNLPRLENKTREMIDSETGKALLKSHDAQFEFKLLQSQVEGTNYASYLAKALAEVESNAERKTFLLKTASGFSALHDKVYQMILGRYVR